MSQFVSKDDLKQTKKAVRLLKQSGMILTHSEDGKLVKFKKVYRYE